MKVGDLVKHRESGDYGIIMGYETNIPGIPGGMVTVSWMKPAGTVRDDWMYRTTVLEVVDESR